MRRGVWTTAWVALGSIWAAASANAELSWAVVSQPHQESTQRGLGCVAREAGAVSYWELNTSSTAAVFHVHAVADAQALAAVHPLNALCWGASDTASDTWTWTVAMRIDRDDPGRPVRTVADVDVSLSIPDWYRTLQVYTVGDTDAKVHAQVDFYFVGPDGPIPVATLSLDNAEYRSELGISLPEDWSDTTGDRRIEMTAGDPVYGTLYATGQFKVTSYVDVDVFGDLYAKSVSQFTVRAQATARVAPPPTVSAIPTLSGWAMALVAALLGVLGARALRRPHTR